MYLAKHAAALAAATVGLLGAPALASADFDVTIGAAATSHVTTASTGGTTTFTANAAGATVSATDITTAMTGGDDVEVLTGPGTAGGSIAVSGAVSGTRRLTLGAGSGNIAITAGISVQRLSFSTSGGVTTSGVAIAADRVDSNAGYTYLGASTNQIARITLTNASAANNAIVSNRSMEIGGSALGSSPAILTYDAGSITQAQGPVTVSGGEAFFQANGSIDLADPGNEFTLTQPLGLGAINGHVDVDAGGANPFILGASFAHDDFTLTTAQGVQSQSGPLTVGGDATVTAAGQIVLNNPNNDFTGKVSLFKSGGLSIGASYVRDVNDLVLGSATFTMPYYAIAGGSVTFAPNTTITTGTGSPDTLSFYGATRSTAPVPSNVTLNGVTYAQGPLYVDSATERWGVSGYPGGGTPVWPYRFYYADGPTPSGGDPAPTGTTTTPTTTTTATTTTPPVVRTSPLPVVKSCPTAVTAKLARPAHLRKATAKLGGKALKVKVGTKQLSVSVATKGRRAGTYKVTLTIKRAHHARTLTRTVKVVVPACAA